MLAIALASSTIQLVPDGTLLFHLALIIVMVVLLNMTLLRPINRILEERDRRTRGRLQEAEKTMHQVEERLTEYEAGLRQARAEAYSRMEQERTGVSRERESKLKTVREEMGQKVTVEAEKLRAESKRVKETLSLDAQKLAVDISRQILHRPIESQPRS